MKDPNKKMSLYMGVTLSFFLSLTGLLGARQFTLPAFISNYIISFVISMIIGFFVPMKKVTDSLGAKFNIPPRTMKARVFDSLVSDIIYTPIITLCMVTMAYFQATKHGARLFFPAMLGKSLVISMIVGFLLIFVFMPLFLKIALKNVPKE